MDIFGGTGTVALEARKLCRKAITIDIGETYSQMAVDKVTAIPNPLED
jgi:adenine-specific DNA methylase